jgi:hypothetical protein
MSRVSRTTAIRCVGYVLACRRWATRAASINNQFGDPIILPLCAECADRAHAAHDLISSWGALTAPGFAESFWKVYPTQKPKYD